MRNLLIASLLGLFMLVCSCDLLEDTSETAEGGGEGAVGIAEKMGDGTLGDTDMDTGESTSEDEDSGE